jgi:hypothetical protein
MMRLLKKNYFYLICDFNHNLSVCVSGTVEIGYGGDPWLVGGSDIQSEALSR